MITEVVVVHDVACASCSEIAYALPDLLRVPVRVRSCRDPQLAAAHPDLPAAVRRCATPALGVVRGDGTVRWWSGRRGALAVLPVVRRGELREATALLLRSLRR